MVILPFALWTASDLAALWIERGEDVEIVRNVERCPAAIQSCARSQQPNLDSLIFTLYDVWKNGRGVFLMVMRLCADTLSLTKP
jgi:hypothetical protein